MAIPPSAVPERFTHEMWRHNLHELAFLGTLGIEPDGQAVAEDHKIDALNRISDGLGAAVFRWHRTFRDNIPCYAYQTLTDLQQWAWKWWLHEMWNAVSRIRTSLATGRPDLQTQIAAEFLVSFTPYV